MRRCARLAPTFEGFDDDHVSAAAGAWRTYIDRFFGCIIRRRRNAGQLAGAFEVRPAGGAAEQPVMPDAVEPARQDTEQEAADELVGAKRHHLLAIGTIAAMVFVAVR